MVAHLYHATMPTDALKILRNNMKETQALGFPTAKARQIDLGTKVRSLLESKNFISVAAPGFQSPGVVVSLYIRPGHSEREKIYFRRDCKSLRECPFNVMKEPIFAHSD